MTSLKSLVKIIHMKKILKLVLFFIPLQYSFIHGNTNADPAIDKVSFAAQIFIYQDETFLSLNYLNAPHWHTYWKNPGTTGLPIEASFRIDGEEFTPPPLEWPTPINFPSHTYGFEGSYSLFFKLQDFKKLEGKFLEITSHWFACKDVCVPGKSEVSGIVRRDARYGTLPIEKTFKLIERLRDLPEEIKDFPKNIHFKVTRSDEKNILILSMELSPIKEKIFSPHRNIFTPFSHPLLDFKKETLHYDKDSLHITFQVYWNGPYEDPPYLLEEEGFFTEPLRLKFLFQNPWTQTDQIIPLTIESYHPYEKNILPTSSSSILYYLLLAFLGGLILNIMPCVLPVISLKLFALLKHRDEGRKTILLHNFIYSLGILSTFSVLAILVVLLKNSSESIGWGFHLQSSTFVAIMTIIVFVFALNFFDLYQFKIPGGKFLSRYSLEKDLFGNFFSGFLATILSTPCSAPFLGTALTFAFTRGSLEIFLILLSVGSGMAAPFMITAFFPSLIKILPHPGKWMNDIKKILGICLILTSIWLLDVFSTLTDSSFAVPQIQFILTMTFFLFYMHRTITNKKRYLLIVLVPLFLTGGHLLYSESLKKTPPALLWKKWSVQAMEEAKEKKRPLFINFTADWCFTCKVNKKLFLDTDKFKNIVEETDLQLLKADWTRRDPPIEKWLRLHGKVGIPAYFLQTKDGRLISLGEMISTEKILKILKKSSP